MTGWGNTAPIPPTKPDAEIARMRRAMERRFPVIEIFGPTIQGEGPQAGAPCSFVRFGGCDYRCSWCDSMYAVEPAEVRKNAKRMTSEEIIGALPAATGWVILSGGNPALLSLDDLVKTLRDEGNYVACETQGSRWKPWLMDLDSLVISPKPPSSGMATKSHEAATRGFLHELQYKLQDPGRPLAHRPEVTIKVVIFNEQDYEWAVEHYADHDFPLYFSVGTPQLEGENPDLLESVAIDSVLTGYHWLCKKVANDTRLDQRVRVLPQLHVLAYGAYVRGV